jgi:gallate decarboxylase subunit D
MAEGVVFTETEGEIMIEARAVWLGQDLLVILTGGKAHIGAVAVFPTTLEDAPNETTRGLSVISVPGHREDVVVEGMAENLSRRLKRTVAIVAGMHWDNLGKDGIDTAVSICAKLEERMALELIA